MGGEAFKSKLAKIELLRFADDFDALVAGLRKALKDRSNYAVAKAAAIAGERYVTAIIPELIVTYERLFEDGLDPLALGKRALAQALKNLDHRDAAVYVRGLQHIQLEPVWGGSADVAGGLRAICAHALVACDIDTRVLLEMLIDQLVDSDKAVRVEVVRAIEQTGGPESMLLLRFKALAGDADAEVVGACFEALLAREPREAVAFVKRFLNSSKSDLVFEAISALAASRAGEAIAIVEQFWRTEIAMELRRAVVFSCAASPLVEAGEFLLTIVADPRADLAASALAALATSRFRDDLRERARRIAGETGDEETIAAYGRAFESL